MAVTTIVRPVLTPLTFRDPRLPVGRWTCLGSSTGDATGGTNSLSCNWGIAPANLLFSCEEVSVSADASATDRNVRIALTTGEASSSGTIGRFSVVVVAKGDALFDQSAPTLQLTRLIFTAGSTTAWALDCMIVNTLGPVLRVDAWGYLWEGTAYNYIGGPIRPGEFLPPL